MRILYLHQYFASPQSHVGTRSYEFARRWIAAGHEVRVITSTAMLPPPYNTLDEVTGVTIDGIPVTVIPVPYGNAMPFERRIRAFFKFAVLASREAMRGPVDVIYATSTPLTIAVPGLAARLRYRVPMVFEVRDLWPELPIAIGALKNPLARLAARSLEWIAYHASAHIIALSPGMAEGVMRRGIDAARVTVIPNSCDHALFDVPPERGRPIRAQLGLAPNQPLIVYTGAFGRINGVDYLVDVAAQAQTVAPDMHFLLVGDGAMRAAVEERARRLGVLDRNVHIWEPLPKKQLVDVLAAATMATSIFVPLRPMWNNSANKFFDALAAGKPVAINYGGWQADLLNRHGAGLVLSPTDHRQAAHDLADFTHDEHRLAQAADAARQLARTQFDRDRLARQLEQVLAQVAGLGRG